MRKFAYTFSVQVAVLGSGLQMAVGLVLLPWALGCPCRFYFPCWFRFAFKHPPCCYCAQEARSENNFFRKASLCRSARGQSSPPSSSSAASRRFPVVRAAILARLLQPPPPGRLVRALGLRGSYLNVDVLVQIQRPPFGAAFPAPGLFSLDFFRPAFCQAPARAARA